ncbi:MAG: GatB/YqeY domain-containing protein [Candidatus Omnitrophica bacterium]|nr:GatB/YqeY domain-containing protein [Candidatus Omnitrophota bacterium]
MLEERIYKDYVEALKSRNKEKSDFLSFIRAEVKNAALELKKNKLEDNEVLTVLAKNKKRLEDAKSTLGASSAGDFLEKTEKEIVILSEYLPKKITDSELSLIVEEAVKAMGASSIKDMGRVMKEVLAKVGVTADSKTVSDMVKKRLSSG